VSQLTAAQRQLLAQADADGRVLVTMVDDRIAIILPPVASDADAATALRRVIAAVEAIRLTPTEAPHAP
jgi:hypothetical protein